ncbi:MAG TPA: 50S ribosomal protein L10 [Blastocatellia bacterium]|nr:50S ribosomal protein L10 [Blastocatellia bacterium]
MKSKETKQKDLTALTESLRNSKSAMVVSFKSLTVGKDQEFRNSVREAGAKYQVVKNTLARIAVKGTEYEQATDVFKGVTAIAWTDSDPVVLSKAISKFVKENSEIYSFKAGIVDGKLVDFAQLNTIASLPSKEELISKLLFVLNAQAQRLVTVINAVPRDLAVVIKQIGEKAPAPGAKPAENAEAPVQEEVPAAETVSVEAAAEAPAEAIAEAAEAVEAPAEVTEPVDAPAAEAADDAPAADEA